MRNRKKTNGKETELFFSENKLESNNDNNEVIYCSDMAILIYIKKVIHFTILFMK